LGGLGGLLAFLLHSFVEFNAHIPANALWFTVLAALTLKTLSNRKGKQVTVGEGGQAMENMQLPHHDRFG
jgi:hypothetical protein